MEILFGDRILSVHWGRGHTVLSAPRWVRFFLPPSSQHHLQTISRTPWRMWMSDRDAFLEHLSSRLSLLSCAKRGAKKWLVRPPQKKGRLGVTKRRMFAENSQEGLIRVSFICLTKNNLFSNFSLWIMNNPQDVCPYRALKTFSREIRTLVTFYLLVRKKIDKNS